MNEGQNSQLSSCRLPSLMSEQRQTRSLELDSLEPTVWPQDFWRSMPTSLRAALSDWFFWSIGPIVFVSRWLTMSQPYFGDALAIIRASQDHSYVIQPPGYWIYCHIAGLYTNPGFGLGLINALVSALGSMVFYLVCLHLTTRLAARWATAAYSVIFFAWFAGSTHSSYAGELLFPALMLLFMVQYVENPKLPLLLGVAGSYALVGGVRPSDGMFLGLALLYFSLRYVRSWKDRIFMLGIAGALCLFWFIPQKMALAATDKPTISGQFWPLAQRSSLIVAGASKLALSNIIRVAFPLGIAFWSLLPAIFFARENRFKLILWIWIIPGVAFFALLYISDAPYLCFLVPAIILLALTPRPGRLTYVGLAVCVGFNVAFFLFARPAPVHNTRSLAVAIYSADGPHYCAWALRHQWQHQLSNYTDVPSIGNEIK
jgi:hypothetical protein